MTLSDCGADGWARWAVGLDGHEREGIGAAFARWGRAKAAERALEAAGLARFGTLRPEGPTLLLRSDNSVGFPSQRCRAAGPDSGLRQAFLPPYVPEQHGLIEQRCRRGTEACVGPHRFANVHEGRRAGRRWIAWSNTERSHHALGYLSPQQDRSQQLQRVA